MAEHDFIGFSEVRFAGHVHHLGNFLEITPSNRTRRDGRQDLGCAIMQVLVMVHRPSRNEYGVAGANLVRLPVDDDSEHALKPIEEFVGIPMVMRSRDARPRYEDVSPISAPELGPQGLERRPDLFRKHVRLLPRSKVAAFRRLIVVNQLWICL